MSEELTVVVPTRNENDNIAPLVDRIVAALPRGGEIIFVDDSDDATPEQIRAVAQAARGAGWSVLLAHRHPGERDGGLGGAVVTGMRASTRPWICVLDADLQHPPEVIGDLLSTARERQADLVIASRRATQGSAQGFGALRSAVSHSSATVARALFPTPLRAVTDPMSGFFLVRRQAVDLDTLRPRGFKILLELVVAVPGLRVAEAGFAFGTRHAGASKASWREGLAYLGHLTQLRLRTWTTPPRPADARFLEVLT